MAGLIVLLSFFITGFDLTGMSVLEWSTNNITVPMSGGEIDLAQLINASDFLLTTTSLNATINGTTLTIGPAAAGQYTLEITATKDGQISTNELLITVQSPQEESITLDFVNPLTEPQFLVDFWSYTIGGEVQIELSHRGNESQSVWGENTTASSGIAQPGEKITVTVPLNTTATLYIGLNGAAYAIDTRGISLPETEAQVQTPRQSEAVKTQKNEAVGKKVEEDAENLKYL